MTTKTIRLASAGISALLGIAALAGCMRHEKPNFIYMPEMVYSPALKAQEGGANRLPPKGTVPRGYSAIGYDSSEGVTSVYAFSDIDAAGRGLKNPLPRTKAVMMRGQKVYQSTCAACHGPAGEGDGGVTGRGYPRPPSLHDRAREWPDGSLFHIITTGGPARLMPSYSAQIPPDDRWAAIHFIRALQRSKRPTPDDLKAWEQATQ